MKERESNFELLRIFCMLIILFAHFSHGAFDFDINTITVNRLYIQFIKLGGKVGVDVFVLISGYFLIDKKSFNLNKLFKLWLQIFFYSIVFYSLFILFGNESFKISSLIKNIFPITFNIWWFASTYFVLYIISPYLNKLLNSLTKKQYKNMLIIMLLMWCIIPTFTSSGFQSNSLIWFTFLYSVAGYIKKNVLADSSSKKYFVLTFIMIFLTYMSVVVFDILGTKIGFFANKATYFYHIQKLPIFLISLFMFMSFKNIKLKSKAINFFSKTMFGVYLIHEHNYVRKFLWLDLFHNSSYQNSTLLIPYSLIICILVFVCCILIELLRIYLLEKRYSKYLDMLLNKVENKFGEVIR